MAPFPFPTRFPRSVAIDVVRELCGLDMLRPVVKRLIVAGSLRRRKETVGDVEILFVPRFEERPAPGPGDMFAKVTVNLADELIAKLVGSTLGFRLNAIGSHVYGPSNKLLRHRATGVPVDLFTATEKTWWNYLVYRTGPKESNVMIATRAHLRGYEWNPTGEGYTHLKSREVIRMMSEREVFEFVGLKYLEPRERR